MHISDENKLLRIISGEVTVHSKLTSFLYDLLRDHLPAGVVEELVRNAQEPEVHYTNGWLAKYAEDLALRLEEKIDPVSDDMVAYEEQYEKEREERRKRRRAEEHRMMRYDRD